MTEFRIGRGHDGPARVGEYIMKDTTLTTPLLTSLTPSGDNIIGLGSLGRDEPLSDAPMIMSLPFISTIDELELDKIRDSDVFLLPSHHEGCPNSVLEALASGCFVISTGVGALKEVIHNGTNGLIVGVQDPKDLANKMEWCLQNVAQMRKVGKDNVEYAFNSFESRKIVAQISNIYQELLSTK